MLIAWNLTRSGQFHVSQRSMDWLSSRLHFHTTFSFTKPIYFYAKRILHGQMHFMTAGVKPVPNNCM